MLVYTTRVIMPKNRCSVPHCSSSPCCTALHTVGALYSSSRVVLPGRSNARRDTSILDSICALIDYAVVCLSCFISYDRVKTDRMRSLTAASSRICHAALPSYHCSMQPRVVLIVGAMAVVSISRLAETAGALIVNSICGERKPAD